ncbi:MAG: heterodisulfide reductase-related iron-sulfur binding cluster [Pseudomonadota bacterium]
MADKRDTEREGAGPVRVPYFPGCTLKSHARSFERTALEASRALGIELEEMPRWVCCGTVYSMATDDLMHQVAPVRNLARVAAGGAGRVVTLCSMCYGTLKQAAALMEREPAKLETINGYLERDEGEPGLRGRVRVLHLLELLAEELRPEVLEAKVVRPLAGLKVAPYYGCLLVRPAEGCMEDSPENPSLMQDLLQALGAEPVANPYATECCGSYHTALDSGIVARRAYQIIEAARAQGADIIALSCPLCDFNLDRRQAETQRLYPHFQPMPVVYFTELLALALGLAAPDLEGRAVDPRPLLSGLSLWGGR